MSATLVNGLLGLMAVVLTTAPTSMPTIPYLKQRTYSRDTHVVNSPTDPMLLLLLLAL
jgi:hypothetical protein